MEPPCWDKADEAALRALQNGVALVPWQINLLRAVLDGSVTTALVEHRRRTNRQVDLLRDAALEVPPVTVEFWRPPPRD